MIALGAGTATISSAQQVSIPPLQSSLSDGPMVPGPYGPLSASDADRDGQVTRPEMENFESMGPERWFGLSEQFLGVS